MSKTTLVRIRARFSETPSAVTLVLEPVEWQQWGYQAGQFILVVLTINGKQYHRAYSLGSAPDLDPYPFITVKRVAGGVVSNYINDQIAVGNILEVYPPQGPFVLNHAPAIKKQYIAVAGGSGMTPIFSLVKQILAKQALSQVHLLSVNKRADEIMYQADWERLKQTHPHRLLVTHALTEPSANWQGVVGRLTPDRVNTEQLLTQTEWAQSEYILCGPQAMMASWKSFLENQNVPIQQIHSEDFGRVPSLNTNAGETANQPASELIFKLPNGTTESTEALAGETILDAALDAGVDIPYGCAGGLCNLCRGRCLEGAVSMETDEGLTEEEIAQGYVLTCVAQATTPRVVISLEADPYES